MKLFLLIGGVAMAIAMFPLWFAIFGNVMGWSRTDPTWAAALPFLLFYTVPIGMVVAIVCWAIQFAYSMWG